MINTSEKLGMCFFRWSSECFRFWRS